MDAQHLYQREHANHLVFKMITNKRDRGIVNIACKEDPARLGYDFGATNVDVVDYDPHTDTVLTVIPNFIQASADDLPFDSKSFWVAVLGELIEHCTPAKAAEILMEARRVIHDYGHIVLTFPLDDRPSEKQHEPARLVEWHPGVTSWHQTVWTEDLLANLFAGCSLVEVHRHQLVYPGMANGEDVKGWGICLVKEESWPTAS